MLLVIETGFAALSVALIGGDELLAEHHEIVGRGHAERLLPAVAALLADHAPPSAIVVDGGPGSYTGLRVGIAAARALGLAWGVDVTATTSTALLAAGVFARRPDLRSVTAVLDAGRGQVYAQTITADWRGDDAPRAATPAAVAASLPADAVLSGSGAKLVVTVRHFATVAGDYPRAADARALPEARRQGLPTPCYLEPVTCSQDLAEPIAPTNA
jgi:tRNA threonylcarbamoyladenosine biosynthesis protein TsaB